MLQQPRLTRRSAHRVVLVHRHRAAADHLHPGRVGRLHERREGGGVLRSGPSDRASCVVESHPRRSAQNVSGATAMGRGHHRPRAFGLAGAGPLLRPRPMDESAEPPTDRQGPAHPKLLLDRDRPMRREGASPRRTTPACSMPPAIPACFGAVGRPLASRLGATRAGPGSPALGFLPDRRRLSSSIPRGDAMALRHVSAGAPKTADAPFSWAVVAGRTLHSVHVPIRADGSVETGTPSHRPERRSPISARRSGPRARRWAMWRRCRSS